MITKRESEYIKSRLSLPWIEYIKIYTSIKGKKILDVGCGYGWLYEIINKEGGFYYGLDKNFESVNTARNLWEKGNFDIGTSENIPYKDNFFDILITIDTIEHMENIKKSFEEFYRVLKKDGFLFLFGPNFFSITNYDSSLKEKFRFILNILKNKKETYIKRPGVISFLLVKMLKKTGFKKVDFIPPLNKKFLRKRIFKYMSEFLMPTIKIYAKNKNESNIYQ